MELQYKIVKTDFNEINAIHSIVFDYVTKEGKIFERKQLNISEAYSNLEDVSVTVLERRLRKRENLNVIWE